MIKNSLYYTIGNFAAAAIPFLLIPFLTRYLSPTEYGTLSNYNVLFSVLNTFTGLSVQGAIVREYNELNKKGFSIFVFNCFLILLASTLFVTFSIILLDEFVSGYTFIDVEFLPFIVVASALQFLMFIQLAVFQVKDRGLKFIILQVSTTLIHSLIAIVLIAFFTYGWEAKLWGQFFTYSVAGGFILINLIKTEVFTIQFSLRYIKMALLFGVPLIPHTLGMYVINFSDRLLVSNILGIEANGIFTVGVQFGMIILFLQDAFNKAWLPWFYKSLKLKDDATNRRIVKYTYIYIVIILIASVSYALIVPFFLPLIIDSRYSNIEFVILFSSVGFAFNGMYKMVTNYLFYERKTYLLSIITFLTAIINIVLNLHLIKSFGMNGASLATMLSFLVSFILTWIFSQKIYPMPWLK